MYTYFWDIETSTITCDNGEKMQVTYLSNLLKMCVETGHLISSLFFRTIEETIDHLRTLEECTVWSHNLDYELTFLLRDLGDTTCGSVKLGKKGEVLTGIYNEEIQEVILRDKHSPLAINVDMLPHITFRDSYALFNKSVAVLGEELNLPKLDYDYKVVRLPWDELSQHDYDYNERDNVIVATALYKYMVDNNLEFDEIPLTFTSFVKRKRKEFIERNFGKKAINKFYFDRNEQIKDFNFFELTLKTFQGGLTASNLNETGKIINKGVYSIDKKSDYPHQMCSRFFPFYSEKTTVHYTTEFANRYFKLNSSRGYYGIFKFKNIRIANRNYLLPISSSQLSKGSCSSDRVLFNGKLLSASEIIIPMNNIDMDTLKLVYKFDEVECIEIFATSKSRRLRQEEISFLLDAFHLKETVPEEKKDTLEYALAKVFINANYGIKVTAPIKSSYTIENGEIENDDYFSYNIDDRKDIYTSFTSKEKLFGGTLDIFSDGCYITSFARHELVALMKKLVDLGCNVVYSDTDSIKFYLNTCSEIDVITLINNENVSILKSNKSNIRFKNYKKQNNVSDKHYEKICRLGIWEIETVDENKNPKPLPTFITFGAKKYGYITHDKKVITTIAGCNRFKPSIAIKNLAALNKISLEESFKLVLSCGTQFDVTASGRTVSKADKRLRSDMDLLTYKGRKINQYGGIIIEDTTYTLNTTLNDSKILGHNSVDLPIMQINLKGEVKYDF